MPEVDLGLLSSELKFFSEQPSKDAQLQEDEEDDEEGVSSIPIKPNQKRTRGKQKIPIQFIDDRIRRCSTFSKRKTGLMKKAFELAKLTGAEVLLVVASETSHVYTYTTERLKAMVESESGRELIQECLGQQSSSTSSMETLTPPIESPEPPQQNQSDAMQPILTTSSTTTAKSFLASPTCSMNPIPSSSQLSTDIRLPDTACLCAVAESSPQILLNNTTTTISTSNQLLSFPFSSIFPTILQLPVCDGSATATSRENGVVLPFQFCSSSSANHAHPAIDLDLSSVSQLCFSIQDFKNPLPPSD